MKGKKKSPGGLSQSKITAFYSRGSKESPEKNDTGGRKRKGDDEVYQTFPSPKKIAMRVNCESPDIFLSSPERKAKKREIFADENKKEIESDIFPFEDFENDPFLSPRKEKSPRKNVLAENSSFSPSDENFPEEKSEINFETLVRCKVLKSTIQTKDCFQQILNVKDGSGKVGVCKLRDVWTSSSFHVNDDVSIQATLTNEGWVVDNKNGYVVLYPDIIISSTSLVSSMFCARQGLFNNFYKGIDVDGEDRMLIGRLVHEFLQECLKIKSCSDEDLTRIIEGFMQSRNYLRDFYFSNLKVTEIKGKVESFVPHIKNFIDVYVNKTTPPSGKNFKGTIENVLDIEELIRSPTLGCQGRIDVTVKIKSRDSEKIAPLELKTGRASFSNEHKSQLTLYILLMQELGRKVESGLLLYLKENIIEEVIPTRDEIRNLFLLRNHFVGFYKNMGSNNLPDPIRNSKACGKCSYLRICTTYLRAEESNALADSHPLNSIEIPDIKPTHVNYFNWWNKMLWMEFEKFSEELPDDVEFSNLRLESSCEGIKDFKHNFRMCSEARGNALRQGAFVHVMTEKNFRICTGQVVEVTGTLVVVALDRKLDDFSGYYKIVVFQTKFLNFYLTNLGWLLGEQFENLRQIIIDKRLPTFEKKFDKKDFVEKCMKNLMDLNEEQRKAVLKSLLCNDYMLIKGPPGTGKTQTIVAMVRILTAMDKSVLIACHTHSSVDNILLRLSDLEFLRLGSLKSVRPVFHEKCYATLLENCSTVEDIQKIYSIKVVASTCYGLDTDFISKKSFDCCIVDESSQVLQPEILRPLFCSKKFILVGDDDQLPPIVQSQEAKKLGMDQSMFEWLTNESSTVNLRFQYRMNSVINSLANAITYNGMIECANEGVANATLKVSTHENYQISDEWIKDVLSNDINKSVIFVDTSDYFQHREGVKLPEESRSSVLEANIIMKLIDCLIKFGLREESIGVITPYWDQIGLLKGKLEKGKLVNIELNTVDQYQGRDKETILFSCAKENQSNKEVSEFELLSDKRRLTVAVTRAKHKLIFVGDRQTVVKYKPFQKLLENLKDCQLVSLRNGEKNFSWENFVD